MAIRLEDEYTESEPASADYPGGGFKNETISGLLDGTPFEKAWANDLQGFFQKMLDSAGVTPSGTPDTVLVSQYFEAFRKMSGKLKDGKKYQFLSGVIRNLGAGWVYIDDSEHSPIGFTGISTLGNGTIQLDHVVGAIKVGSLLIVPDETFVKQGILAGGSIGLDLSLITLAAPLEFSVDTVSGDITAPDFMLPKISALAAAGTCDVTHPEVVLEGVPVMSKVGVADYDSSDFRVSYSQTQMLIRGAGEITGRFSYDGANWNYSGPMGNTPTAVWNAGVLTVTHDKSDLFSMNITEESTSYRTTGAVANQTSFDTRFFDAAGTQVVVEDTSMDFYFSRGGCAKRDDLRGLFGVRRGFCQVDANDLVSPSGNLWIIGVLERA